MSTVFSRAVLTMLAIMVVAACSDEPLSPRGAGSGNAVTDGPSPDAAIKGSPGDREALQEILTTFDRTWGVDAATYAGQYGEADFVGPTGEILTTPAEILALYTNIFPAFAGTTRRSHIRAITFLTGTVAVLDIDTRVSGDLPPFVTPWRPGVVRALEKNILVKRAGEWRIVQHQQVLVAPGVE